MSKYIYRHDKEKVNHGWYVVIELHSVRRYFSDKAFGSKHDSFLAALEFRNNQLRKFKLPVSDRVVYTQKRSTNNSGRPGVCKSGPYYYAYFPVEKNQVIMKKYSTKKFGEEGAFEKAIEWREKLEIAVYGMPSFRAS